MIQISCVCTTLCQEGGIFLINYHDRKGRCIAILLKSVGVWGQSYFLAFGVIFIPEVVLKNSRKYPLKQTFDFLDSRTTTFRVPQTMAIKQTITVRAEIITELILERAGPVIFKTVFNWNQ